MIGGIFNLKEDKSIISGHEFNSRFILNSDKYSINLIEAAVGEND